MMNNRSSKSAFFVGAAVAAILSLISCNKQSPVTADGDITTGGNDTTLWVPCNSEPAPLFVRTIAVDRSNCVYASAASPDGLFKSTDRGKTWIELVAPGSIIDQIAVDSKGNILVQSNRNELFLSSDGGSNWVLQWTYLGANTMDCDFRDTLWVGLSNIGGPAIARSPDLGRTWSNSSEGLGVKTRVSSFAFLPSGIYFASGDSWSMSSFTVRSTDFGVVWSSGVAGGTGSGILETATYADSTGLVIGASFGDVNVSTDFGLTWAKKNSGVPTNTITSITVGSERWVILTIPSQGVFYSRDLCNSWVKMDVHSSGAAPREVTTSISGDTYLATYGAGVFRLAH